MKGLEEECWKKSKIMSRGIKGHSPRGGARKVPDFSELLPFNSQCLLLAAIFLPPSLCLPTPPQTYKLGGQIPLLPYAHRISGTKQGRAADLFLTERKHPSGDSKHSLHSRSQCGQETSIQCLQKKEAPKAAFSFKQLRRPGCRGTRCPGV